MIKRARHKYSVVLLVIVSFFMGPQSVAADAQIKYIADPLFEPLYETQGHPLVSMVDLVNEGDPRAQYILADLYEKGKGGVEKRPDVAKILFEQSAKQGMPESFIRLAALARAEKDLELVYQWYILADNRLLDAKKRNWVRTQKSAIDFDKKQIKKIKKAAKNWERTRLDPVKIFSPAAPLEKDQVDDVQENEKNSKTSKDELTEGVFQDLEAENLEDVNIVLPIDFPPPALKPNTLKRILDPDLNEELN